MNEILIYQKPRWSKSRESVKILENSGVKFKVIEYMNNPLSENKLKDLALKMQLKPKDFIRTRESIFKDLDLKKFIDDDEYLFKCMAENPKLIERPIIVKGDKVVIGRPPEKVNDLL